MLLARKGPDSDVFVVTDHEHKTFYCLHNDPTRMRMWEPLEAMTGNEMYRHLKMHRQIGHKVPEHVIDRCLTLQMT